MIPRLVAAVSVAALLVAGVAAVAAVQVHRSGTVATPVPTFDPVAIPFVAKIDGALCEDKRTIGPIVGGFDCDLDASPQDVLRWYEDRLAREGWTFEGYQQPIVVEGTWTRGEYRLLAGVVRIGGKTNLNLVVVRKLR